MVNGIGELARRLEGGQPALRGLVRRAAVGGQVRTQRLDHHPLARAPPRAAERGPRARSRRRSRAAADRSPPAPAGTSRPGSRPSRRSRARPARSRASAYRSSGDSPSVNSASWHPASAPGEAMASTSSGERYGAATCLRCGRERAVAAPVAAQAGQRDEDLRGERHPASRSLLPRTSRARPLQLARSAGRAGSLHLIDHASRVGGVRALVQASPRRVWRRPHPAGYVAGIGRGGWGPRRTRSGRHGTSSSSRLARGRHRGLRRRRGRRADRRRREAQTAAGEADEGRDHRRRRAQQGDRREVRHGRTSRP